MGQEFSKKNKKPPASVWGYGGTESTVGGLYLSSTKITSKRFSLKKRYAVSFYLQLEDRRKTVFFKQMEFSPSGIEITMPDDGSISVYFMNGETRVGDPVVWTESEYELNELNHLVSLTVKNDIVSAAARASVFVQRDAAARASVVVLGDAASGARAVVQSNAAARDSVVVQCDAESPEIDSLPKRLLASSAHNIISGDWSVLSEHNVLPIDGSATLTSEFAKIVKGTDASDLLANGTPLLTACHSSVNFDRRLPQISNTFGVKLCQDFVQCGPQIDESASALVLLSDSISSPVLQGSVMEFSFIFCVNNDSFPVIITIPTQMIDFFRTNGPNVLGTVSQLIGQFGGLLELSDNPSKTTLGVSTKFGDIRCHIASKMFNQIQQLISLIMQQILSKQSESTVLQIDWFEKVPTGWLDVNLPKSRAIVPVSNVCSGACALKSAESGNLPFTVHLRFEGNNRAKADRRLSVNSHDDGSATRSFKVFEIDNGIARIHQNVSGGGNSATCTEHASSATKYVNRHQEFARCGPPEESITGSKTVRTFSGTEYVFTVSDDSKSIVYKRLKSNSSHNIIWNVQFNIVNISSLKVYALLTGVYLIVIQTNSGQTYLSGYLSTNATPIFATFQITSHLNKKRFQSVEHVSGTVFRCLFSDKTERIFSIESNASITEVLDA